MSLVLGIDLGTSYFKLGLFDRTGRGVGLGRVPVPSIGQEENRCELSIENFWSSLRQGLEAALCQAGRSSQDIQAVAYSSQANSFVLLDGRDQPVTPLILWPDQRTEPVDENVQQLWDRGDFLSRTGLGIAPCNQLALCKLRWFQQNRSDLWSRVSRIMTISDYFVFGLTDKPVGDAGTACLLGLWDLSRGRWWTEAAEKLDLPTRMLSTLLRPGELAGELSARASDLLSLEAGIPLAVGSLDHPLAALGVGLSREAELSVSLGTVLACVRFTETFEPKTNCCSGPAAGKTGYYQLAFDNNGASVLEWYQKNHAPQQTIEQLLQLAGQVSPGCEGLLVFPLANEYAGLEGFQDVQASHTPGHFARAILESTARTLCDLVDRLYGAAKPQRIVVTGGGARSDLWLQILAETLGVEVVRCSCPEPACRGAAMLATVAAGWFSDLKDASAKWVSTNQTFPPTPN